MRLRIAVPFLAALVPVIAAAQSASPVADAFRNEVKSRGKNLMAAAEVMPADKYGFKPTPAQMSFGDVVLHLAGGTDAHQGHGRRREGGPNRPPQGDIRLL